MKQIDVPSEDSPNPHANEIQNDLYKNDKYNYKQLYGETPSPPVQTQSYNDISDWTNADLAKTYASPLYKYNKKLQNKAREYIQTKWK